MSTKFVSKNSNYMIVLTPGVEGNRALGTHAVSGLYVKFQSGSVDVKEESVVEMLRAHPSFGSDFIEIKEEEVDPFVDNRYDGEPDHVISEVRYGHVEKAIGVPSKVKLTPQLRKVIEGEALKMLPGLLKKNPEVLKEIILGLAADMKKKEETQSKEGLDSEKTEVKRGPGRPAKVE